MRRNRAFHLTFAAALCSALIFSQFGSSYSALVVGLNMHFKPFGFDLTSESIYGLLLGWNGLLIVCAELPLTGITQRFDPRKVMAIGYSCMGIGFTINTCAHGVALLFTAMTLFTVGEMISAPVSSAYMARLSPERLRGRYMGILSLSWCLASMIGPPVGLKLIESGSRQGWILCGVIGLLGAGLILSSEAVDEPMEDEAAPLADRKEPIAEETTIG
jgi:MFS family permease